MSASTTKLVSTSSSSGSAVSAASKEETPLVAGGLPRGRTAYLPRTERGELIDVFDLTLLVAARIPRAAPGFLEVVDFEVGREDINNILPKASTRPYPSWLRLRARSRQSGRFESRPLRPIRRPFSILGRSAESAKVRADSVAPKVVVLHLEGANDETALHIHRHRRPGDALGRSAAAVA